MKYITANGTRYECHTVRTGTNQISFEMQGQEIAAIATVFRAVTGLSVSAEDNATYGTYENLSFESAIVYGDGSITVIMHIPDATELRLFQLESTQTEQDAAIADLMFGGEVQWVNW